MADAILLKSSGGSTSDDCTALKSHVLEGETAVTRDSGDEPAEGTMPKKINGQIANGCTFYQEYLYYQIPYGYYPNAYTNTECEVRIEQDKVAAAIGVTAEKLMQGQSVLGVNGTATSGDTATPDDLLYGKTAHSKGKKITGKIQSQGPMTLNPGITAKTASVSGKYMTGNITVPAISIPANAIKKGHKITFPDGSSVTGTWEGFVPGANDLFYNGIAKNMELRIGKREGQYIVASPHEQSETYYFVDFKTANCSGKTKLEVEFQFIEGSGGRPDHMTWEVWNGSKRINQAEITLNGNSWTVGQIPLGSLAGAASTTVGVALMTTWYPVADFRIRRISLV